MHTLQIPKREDWFEVAFKSKVVTRLDRELWCRENCAQRWLPGSIWNANRWLFESQEDAMKFWWRWG